jgi:hypothetical protein
VLEKYPGKDRGRVGTHMKTSVWNRVIDLNPWSSHEKDWFEIALKLSHTLFSEPQRIKYYKLHSPRVTQTSYSYELLKYLSKVAVFGVEFTVT